MKRISTALFFLSFRGHRMEQPEQCPIAIHDMMLRTWDTDPTNRPTFLELMDELGDHLGMFSN